MVQAGLLTRLNFTRRRLRPLAVFTSCAKDYEGHSLVHTSFAELPNRSDVAHTETSQYIRKDEQVDDTEPMLHTQKLHNTERERERERLRERQRERETETERETERERETTQYTRKEDDQVDGTGTMLHTQKLHTKKKLC